MLVAQMFALLAPYPTRTTCYSLDLLLGDFPIPQSNLAKITSLGSLDRDVSHFV